MSPRGQPISCVSHCSETQGHGSTWWISEPGTAFTLQGKVTLLLIYRQGNSGSEKASDLSKITQQARGRAGISLLVSSPKPTGPGRRMEDK